MPPRLSVTTLELWLNNNESILDNLLIKASNSTNIQPKEILYLGKTYKLVNHNVESITINQFVISVPNLEWSDLKLIVRNHYINLAKELLLSRLYELSHELNLIPKSINLTKAKTFWGVCRLTTGIRLNWRLLGAPWYVIDYVCIHELCHLVHQNHSKKFWELVDHYTHERINAKQWLNTNGKHLFLLD